MGDLYNGYDGQRNSQDPQALEIIHAEREEWEGGGIIYTRVILQCSKCGLRCEWEDISRNPLGMKRSYPPGYSGSDHTHVVTWVTADRLDEWVQAQGAKRHQAPKPPSRRNPDNTKPPDDRTHNWEWSNVPSVFAVYINNIDGIDEL